MLTSITPLGEWGRGQRYTVTFTALLLGSTAAGAAIGTVAATGGAILARLFELSDSARLLLLASAIALGVVIDLAGQLRRIPSVHRQVNERWLDVYRGWVYGGGFGVQLGLGIATVVTTAGVYVVLAACFLSPTPLVGMIVGGAFGLVRALTVLPASVVRDPLALQRLGAGIVRWRAPVRIIATATDVTAGLLVAFVAALQIMN
jgi:hypothetical protein